MTTYSYQLPQQVPWVDKRGMVDYRWVSVLNKILADQGGGGSGPVTGHFVADGSYASYAPTTLFEGPDASRPSPSTGYLYFALDTGNIYGVVGGAWVVIGANQAITGDATKPAGSTVLTFNTVNATPGTYTFATVVVDEKGLVTLAADGMLPGGNNDVLFVEDGTFATDTGQFEYDPVAHKLSVVNEDISNQLTFNTVVGQTGQMVGNTAGVPFWSPVVTPNSIDYPVTIPLNTSYTVVGMLTVNDMLTNNGWVMSL